MFQESWNLVLWVRGDEVNNPTKFEENVKNLNFYEIYALCCRFYPYGPEIYRINRTKFYGPVINEIYKKNDVITEIMGKI